MIYKVQNQYTGIKRLKSYVTFKIMTLDYYGTNDISIDSYNLNDVIHYNYTYILLGRLGRLNTLKGVLIFKVAQTHTRFEFRYNVSC